MKTKGLLTAILLAALGCDAPASQHNSDDGVETQVTGTLSLKLSSLDSAGRLYRLRNASFHVQGYWSDFPYPSPDAGSPFSTTVSSESDIDASLLSLKLTPGYYDVTLANPDWYLERRSDGTWQRVEQAVLLSARSQSAYVVDDGISSVSFRFGVDGELIDFRSGDLLIDVSIERPGDDAGTTGGGYFGGGTTGGGYFGGGTTGGGYFGGGYFGGGTTGGGYFDAGAPF